MDSTQALWPGASVVVRKKPPMRGSKARTISAPLTTALVAQGSLTSTYWSGGNGIVSLSAGVTTLVTAGAATALCSGWHGRPAAKALGQNWPLGAELADGQA